MSNWTDGLVLGLSAASAGDDELRSLMTQLASGISASFYWPGSGGGSLASAGESVLGNARAAHSGNVNGGYPNGFLSLATQHPAIWHIGVAPAMLAHSRMVDYGPAVVLPGLQRWLTQRGTFSLASSGGDGTVGLKHVSFTTGYDATPPLVQIIVQQSTVSSYIVHVSSISTGGFNSAYSGLVPAPIPSNVTVLWESIGSVTI